MTDQIPTPPPISPERSNLPGSRWPKVLGIILIVFAVFGLLQSLFAPFSGYLTKLQMNPMIAEGADAELVEDYIRRLTTISWIGGVIYFVLGVILLTGGIFLLKRKRVASPLLQTWAVLKIVAGGFISFRQMSLSRIQMDIMMSTNTFAETPQVGEFMKIGATVGMIIGLLFLTALPVFVIIWLNRTKIRDQMKAW